MLKRSRDSRRAVSYFLGPFLHGGSQRPFSRFSAPMHPLSSERLENQCYECPSEDDLFQYKARRWLWNETEQLRRRCLKFDLKAIVQIAEEAASSSARCVEISKLPEGNFNKTFLVTMHDGRQLVARLPNPNAGRPHYTTASEVATMDYVRDRLQIPVPKVLAYNTKASTNGVGAEYIIMEKCPGIELSRVWDNMTGKDRVDIVRQLATFTAKLSKTRFPYYGSLYYAKDVPEAHETRIDDVFSVGPTTSRTWFDDRRGEIDIRRGPWTSAEGVISAIIKREMACLDTFSGFPRDRQQGIFNGPGGYQPSKTYKKAVLQEVSRILPHILPQEDAFTASILWHNDLHSENIFVNIDRPTEITGVIDWQSAHLSPAFLHVNYPSVIEYDGPKLDGFEKPQLPPDFAKLDPAAQKAARDLHTAQSLWGLYQIFLQKQAPDLLRVFRYRESLPCHILGLTGSIFDDGEAYVQSLLSRLPEPEIWAEVAGTNDQINVGCPLEYLDGEISHHKDQLARWGKDVERKARVLQYVGAYTGWDGAVDPEEYDAVLERLGEAKERFLDEESKSPEEREQWAAAWPFKDG